MAGATPDLRPESSVAETDHTPGAPRSAALRSPRQTRRQRSESKLQTGQAGTIDRQ